MKPPPHPPDAAISRRPAPPVYCFMFAVDIACFGSRNDSVQLHLREKLYHVIEEASSASHLPWNLCYREDRGDGLFFVADPCFRAETRLGLLVANIRKGLCHHNNMANKTAKIWLRMAAHAGYIRFDSHGVAGSALVHLFRLLESDQLRNALRDTSSEVALLASHHLYDGVIRHGLDLLDPREFRRINVTNKETRTGAWLWLSGPRQPTTSSPRKPRKHRRR